MQKRTARVRPIEDVFDIYLEELRGVPSPLDREGEVRAATRIEEAERACLSRILEAGVAVPELVAWADAFEAGQRSANELTLLGSYEGDAGARLLARRLGAARAAERRCRRALASTKGTAADRRAARERAWAKRLAAVRDIELGRGPIQDVLGRVFAALRPYDHAGEAKVPAMRVAETTLGRPRATLRKLHAELLADRRRLDAARNFLAKANLRLVVALAKRYRGSGVPFADLVQEGNLGLMRAVDKFDHRVGTRFSTYAAWWIRQAVAREATRLGDTVRVPFGMVERRRKAQRVVRQLTQSLGRAPDAAELAAEMGVSLDRAQRTVEATTSSVSIHETTDDGDRELGEILPDRSIEAADEDLGSRQLQDTARRLLEQLGPRERLILEKRFGLADRDDGKTLREIGEEIGLSRERIRQLEGMALEKLRGALVGR